MTATRTHTRTHVHIEFANPYLRCDQCGQWVTGWHDDSHCGCDAGFWNVPCQHRAGATSACPSWGPVDGCSCRQHLGHVPHGEPPAPAETSAEGCHRCNGSGVLPTHDGEDEPCTCRTAEETSAEHQAAVRAARTMLGCTQCGQPWRAPACGPTHALVQAERAEGAGRG